MGRRRRGTGCTLLSCCEIKPVEMRRTLTGTSSIHSLEAGDDTRPASTVTPPLPAKGHSFIWRGLPITL